MKKVFFAAAVLAVFSVYSFTTDKTDSSNKTTSSEITWLAKKVTGEHSGTVEMKSSTLGFHNNELMRALFVVDMTSIKNTDMEGEYSDKLVGHLKSEDFFNVAKFPEANFTASTIENKGDGNYTLTGDLTIKGISNSLTFDAKVDMMEKRAVATAKVIIDRAKYDVKYGSGSFFEGLGDNLIYDEFELNITINEEL